METTETVPEGVGVPEMTGARRGDESATEATQSEPETFPASYVQELRAEAAKHRRHAKRTGEAIGRLTALAVREATRDVLVDPTDLPISDELLDEDGWPDLEKIEAAARELEARKPHLARRTVSGDVGQGVRGDGTVQGLAAMLRLAAG